MIHSFIKRYVSARALDQKKKKRGNVEDAELIMTAVNSC